MRPFKFTFEGPNSKWRGMRAWISQLRSLKKKNAFELKWLMNRIK